METERLNAQVPRRLRRVLTRHCLRRGQQPRRVVAAAILAYLRSRPQDKLQAMADLHDWELEREIRDAWKRQAGQPNSPQTHRL